MKSREIAVWLQVIFTVIILFSLITPAKSAPGDLDASFGNNGKSIISFTPASDWIEDIAIQADGKIVAVGLTGFTPGVAKNFGVARFNSDGALDATFGNGGSVTTSFSGQFASAYGVEIQPDGKIVVCGIASTQSGNFIVVARYLSNGSLDPSFSSDGKVETPFGVYSTGNAVAIQPDGKIVVAGGTDRDIAVVRYTSDGTPDRRFGYRGKVLTSIGPLSDHAFGIKIQPDGKTIIAASTEIAHHNGNQQHFAVVRYTLNGKVDGTFDADGMQTALFGQQINYPFDLALQPDGKIVLVGYSTSGITGVFALVRYNPDGSLDSSFGAGGKVTTHPGGLEGAAFEIAIQPNGKIVVGGSVRDIVAPNYSDFMLMRYNADGTPDNDFGTGGKVRTGMGAHNDQINAIALQSDGRIVVGGVAVDASDNADFGLARFLGE